MKKDYQKPEMEAIELKMNANLLAGSTKVTEGDSGKVDPDPYSGSGD